MSRTTSTIPLDVSSIAALVVGGLAGYAALVGSREAMTLVALLIPLTAIVLIVHLRVGFSPWLLRGLLFWMLLEIACRLVSVPWLAPTDGHSRLLGAFWLAKPSITVGAAAHCFGVVMLTWFFSQALGSRGEQRASIGILVAAGCAAIGSVAAVGALLRIVGELVPRLGLASTTGSVDQHVVGVLAAAVAILLLRLRVLPT